MKIIALVLVAVLALGLGGCETFQKIDSTIPNVEVCFLVKGQTVCAVKRDGKWTFSATLSAAEKAEAEAFLKANE